MTILAADPELVGAARIARTFRLDPARVLWGESALIIAEQVEPSFVWAVRAAAHEVIVADENEAARKKG